MLPVNEAQRIVLDRAVPRGATVCPLAHVRGRVLAVDLLADRDLPAFPKSMMDGIAVATGPAVQFTIVDEIPAGRMPTRAIKPGEAARIMTGACLPEGADTVVPVEECEFDRDHVTIRQSPRPGQHVQPVGREMRLGEVIVPAWTVLNPAAIGVLATVGCITPHVYPMPTLAVLTTGDEVVEPANRPGPVQLRNSNGPMLVVQAGPACTEVRYLGIAGDQSHELKAKISSGLSADVLVLSGGVSMGTRDLVPGVLQELEVESHFHKVAMKPGKPLFFGSRGNTLVFGLPGNPVSSFVGFELFVRPALRKLAGHRSPLPGSLRLPLAEPFRHRSDRPTYHPAHVAPAEVGESVRPLPWSGSPDLKGLVAANALAVLPAGEHEYRAGEVVTVIRLPE
ncbi:MAG: molybdopterin molybdotransferase MoeA [Gemmataceae bacterium]|nr:molybdopterin molybdotransferase MoeA [Gemmataceae bacterium]